MTEGKRMFELHPRRMTRAGQFMVIGVCVASFGTCVLLIHSEILGIVPATIVSGFIYYGVGLAVLRVLGLPLHHDGKPPAVGTRAAPRHGALLLTAFLMLVVVANLLGATLDGLSLRAATAREFEGLGEMPALAVGVRLTCRLVKIGCAVAVWRWRRWGFYGHLVASIVAFVIGAFYLDPDLYSMFSPVALWLLLRPYWSTMK